MGGADASLPDLGPPPDTGPFIPDGATLCEGDEDCDDGIACTSDECVLPNGFCRFITDATSCQDGIFCNGSEVCDRVQGCLPAPNLVTCDDLDVCTVDRCDEETRTCVRTDRDLDRDGDIDINCGGGDCDDRNARRSSTNFEVCDDLVDNDCDGQVDEPACGNPDFDTCDDPLDISAGGFFQLFMGGAGADLTPSCAARQRDLVATFTLTEERSVEIEASTDLLLVILELRGEVCTDLTPPPPEVPCTLGNPAILQEARVPPGTYHLQVASAAEEVGLRVTFDEPILPPANDTCANPEDVSAGGLFAGRFLESEDDYVLGCGFGGRNDVTYRLDLAAPQNVTIDGIDENGQPITFAVRTTCDDGTTDIRCTSQETTLYSLPADTYFIVVEGPGFLDPEFTLNVQIDPPTAPPPGDTCDDPLPLLSGVQATGTFAGFQDDLAPGPACGFNQREVVHEFTLAEASDVELELGPGGLLALQEICGDADTLLGCRASSRLRVPYLAAGTYTVLAESGGTGAYTLDLTATPRADPPVDAAANETCAVAQAIPADGGLFRGSTQGGTNDLLTNATCGASASSPDAAFELTLTERKRVVASTDGSDFDTVLHVHRDMCVSRGELFCNDDADFTVDWSTIDEVLDAGTYFIVVDGRSSFNRGEYWLEVEVLDP